MTTPTIGHPNVVNGIACSDKNIYKQKILESIAIQRQKSEETSRWRKQKEFEELEAIVQKIDHAFAQNKVVDGKITIHIRLKYVSVTEYAMKDTQDSLNSMLAPKGVVIHRIINIDSDFFSDNCCGCFWTSLVCCCIPRFILDDKYGEKYTLRISFVA